MPSPPAFVTSAASNPPDTPAIGAERIGRRHRNVWVNGVFQAFCLMLILAVFDFVLVFLLYDL